MKENPGLPEEEVNNMLNVMEKSGKKLMDMVEKVLDDESNSNQKESIKLTSGFLIDLAEKVISVNKPKAILKNISLELVEEIKNNKVLLDHTKIEIALNNLVSNALKFTLKHGLVQLVISSNENKIEFQVRDNGIGISENILPLLFDSDMSKKGISKLGTEGEIGTGLGLDVVKKYVNMHNGKVWVESEEKVGTTFFIEVPVKS